MVAGKRRARWIAAAAVPFFAALGAAARPGPDFEHYLHWAQVALSSDIFALAGTTLSPFGVPFSLWAHGTGFAFAAGARLLGPLVDLRGSALATGWLAGVVFWIALYRVLDDVTRADRLLTLLGLGLAFVATHAGFYSFTHASESLSLACLAVMAWWLVVARPWRAFDCLVLGAAGGLLVVIRPQLVLYVALALGVLAARLGCDRRRWRRAALLLIAAFPVLVAGAQVLLTNRWMTGWAFSSPYVYGRGDFRSLDFGRPELAAVLLHPWHGWLVYHPLYGLCLLALGAELVLAASGRQRLLHASLLAVLAVHLYLQGAHFFWWLGVGTFGMRGLAVTAVVLVPILLRHLARRRDEGQTITPWLLAAGACAVWSYGLLRQGETNFSSFGQLLSAQLEQLQEEAAVVNLVPLLIAVATACWLGWAWGGRRKLAITAAAVCCLAWLALVHAAVAQVGPRAHLGVSGTAALKAALAGLPALAAPLARAAPEGRGPGRGLEAAAGLTVLLLFLVVSVDFYRLALRTETADLAQARGQRRFLFVGTLDWGELVGTYREYLAVPGFEEKKRRLHDFLEGWRAAHTLPCG